MELAVRGSDLDLDLDFGIWQPVEKSGGQNLDQGWYSLLSLHCSACAHKMSQVSAWH